MKMAVNKTTNRVLEKIKALEIEKAKLLPLRKEEIFNVLQNSGGLTLPKLVRNKIKRQVA
jgi:hypothetical protein